MREIRFKVWSHMSNNYTMLNRGKGPLPGMKFINGFHIAELQGSNFTGLTYLQNTGIYDKNGVEVYEHDYIELHREGINNEEVTFCVVFKNGGFVLFVEDSEDPGAYRNIDILEEYKFKIVGNIHKGKTRNERN